MVQRGRKVLKFKFLKRSYTYTFISLQGHSKVEKDFNLQCWGKNLNDCKKIKHIQTQGIFLHNQVLGFSGENRVVAEVYEHVNFNL